MRRLATIFLLLLIALSLLPVVQTQAQAAWQPNTAYSVGTLVTYGGHTYKCQQAHTSQVGWEPPNTPALWVDQGVTSGGATATTAKTNTPVPATNTSAPTATSGGSS